MIASDFAAGRLITTRATPRSRNCRSRVASSGTRNRAEGRVRRASSRGVGEEHRGAELHHRNPSGGVGGPIVHCSVHLDKWLSDGSIAEMSTHGVAEAKNHLPELIDRALKGEAIVITRHGQSLF